MKFAYGLFGLLFVTSVAPRALALAVDPGGPWRVAEGADILITVDVTDADGEVSYAWDLDNDGVYNDSFEESATFTAEGVDGPAKGFAIGLVVADESDQLAVEIPISVTNAAPEFTSQPVAEAVIDREWLYDIVLVDHGGDTIEVSVDPEDLPTGMLFDALAKRLTWTPNQGHLLQGEPLGHFLFTISAEDDENARSRQDVSLVVIENTPPPVPPIQYPDGTEGVRTAQPTIILANVDDPDGDVLSYHIETDWNPCFCSPEHMESPALPQGELVTQWQQPRPFNVDVDAGGNTTFYIRRWTNDGIEDSLQELSLWDYTGTGGDGDADADADADADVDADGDDDDTDGGGGRGGCCVIAGRTGGPDPTVLLLLGLLLIRRRR